MPATINQRSFAGNRVALKFGVTESRRHPSHPFG
jgi:hypothetical protein